MGLSSWVLALTVAAGPTADSLLKMGRDAADRGDFESALRAYDRALKLNPSEETYVAMQLHRAVSFNAMGKADKAFEATQAALMKNPLAAFKEDVASPELLALLDKARAATLGHVTVEAPVGTQVTIDGNAHGPAPLKAELPVGNHLIEGRDESGASGKATVVVAYHQEAIVALALTEPPPVRATEQPPVVAPTVVVQPAAPATRAIAITGVATGGALMAAGVAGFVYSRVVAMQYVSQQSSKATSLTVTRSEANAVQVIYPFSIGGFVVGAALAGLGTWGLLSTSSGEATDASAPTVSVTPTPGGAYASFSTAF